MEWVWGGGYFLNIVWFEISGKLRNREGWWNQIPLARCLIETHLPYLGVGGKRECIVHFGREGLAGFCKGMNVPRMMVLDIFAGNFRDSYGVAKLKKVVGHMGGI